MEDRMRTDVQVKFSTSSRGRLNVVRKSVLAQLGLSCLKLISEVAVWIIPRREGSPIKLMLPATVLQPWELLL
jgi:hypothetical protein